MDAAAPNRLAADVCIGWCLALVGLFIYSKTSSKYDNCDVFISFNCLVFYATVIKHPKESPIHGIHREGPRESSSALQRDRTDPGENWPAKFGKESIEPINRSEMENCEPAIASPMDENSKWKKPGLVKTSSDPSRVRLGQRGRI